MNKGIEDIKRLHQSGSLDAAKVGYLTYLAENPQDPEALDLLALVCAEIGDFVDAENYLLQAIALAKNNPAYGLHLANIYKLQNKNKLAIETLQQLIQKFPAFAAADNNLGALFYTLENYDEAIGYLQSAIQKQANYADAYYNLGLAYLKKKAWLDAENVFNALLNLNPQHPGGLFQLGRLKMQQKKFVDASQCFQKVLANHPYHFESLVNLATSYLRNNDFNNAKKYYLQALDLAPQDVQVLFNLGVIAMQENDVKQAVDYYNEVVKYDANHFDAHNNLAIANLAMQKRDAALHHFKETARIDPKNKAIAHTIKILSGDKNITQSPPEYIHALFNSYADHYDAHLKNLLNYQVPNYLDQTAKPILKNLSDLEVLDLGCGTGLTGEIFKKYAKKIIGVDLSEAMLLKAGEKNIYDELIQNEIIHYLNTTTQQFDLIIAGDVLVYFGELEIMFNTIAKHLKPAGYFLFNLEMNEASNFELMPTGRFRHHKKYVDDLAAMQHLKIILYKTLPMRTQQNETVYGHFYLLQKE